MCPVCDKSYCSESSLNVHRVLHTGERPYACTQCDKTFRYTSSKIIHFNAVHLKIPYNYNNKIICEHCGLKCPTNNALKSHKVVHTREKPYTCPKCDKKFAYAMSVKIHDRLIHKKERPFTCTECDRHFSTKSNLKAHKVKHVGEKPFVCTQCEDRFINSSSLMSHIDEAHSDERLYVCAQCRKRFRDDVLLRLHLKSHHP